ncbi:hypothetical protein GPUN_2650 [Glaciecola punicea ACAM 611]|uniref:Uncharacterized protein n=1 Tax=Glaciecola punicea ACAM 611 TaxID=1121923 RepID=H5TEN7_9ALTE|nr:hypothetical protein GPUN_2650 [Glaciecola punicea ACAM 611]
MISANNKKQLLIKKRLTYGWCINAALFYTAVVFYKKAMHWE